MKDSIEIIFRNYFSIGVSAGLFMGLITWFLSWCLSQVIHFFKAISR